LKSATTTTKTTVTKVRAEPNTYGAADLKRIRYATMTGKLRILLNRVMPGVCVAAVIEQTRLHFVNMLPGYACFGNLCKSDLHRHVVRSEIPNCSYEIFSLKWYLSNKKFLESAGFLEGSLNTYSRLLH